jgi:acetyl esterase/lipase
MTRLLLVAALGVAALAPAAAPADLPEAPAPRPVSNRRDVPGLPVTVERNVVYDTIDGQKLMLDIAVPKDGGPHPLVVMLHGGAWMAGGRKDLSAGDKTRDGKYLPSAIEEVAAHGYVAASVSYRLAPKYKFPAQIQDARAAVRFLRANAKEYGIDKDKVAAAGFSAGGHLALLLGLAGKVDGWDVGGNLAESSAVQCVVDFFGPADLSLYAASPGVEDAYMVPVFGKAVKADPEVYKAASPITYASKTSPPTLILHGNIDLIVPIVHSETLYKKLKDAGAPAEMITVRGEGHGWTGPPLRRSYDDALKFLDTHLKGKK